MPNRIYFNQKLLASLNPQEVTKMKKIEFLKVYNSYL